MRSALRAAFALSVAACGGATASKPVGVNGANGSPAAPSSAAPSAGAPAPFDARPRVRTEDCELWVGHAFDEAKIAFRDAIAPCPEKLRSKLSAGSDKAFAVGREKTVANCRKHLGEPYDLAESTCFMQARKLRAMKACGFKTMPAKDADDADPEEATEKLRDLCVKARDAGQP